MKKLAVILALSGLAAFQAADAALISVPSGFGPATITRDTDTNLDWLDISFTNGSSVNQALGLTQAGGPIPGFRLATLEEWIAFSGYETIGEASVARGFALINSMGCTQCAAGTFRLDGIVRELPALDSSFHYAGVVIQEGYNNSFTGGPYIQSGAIDPDFAYAGTGVYLVADTGSTPNNPWLPPGVGVPIDIIVGGGGGIAGVAVPTFVDPDFAIGYDYSVDPIGPIMTSVLIPATLPGGDDTFELIAGGASYNLLAGTIFDLTQISAGGLSSFSIRGIDIGEQIDPTNPLGFVTGLTFSRAGAVSLDMQPFVQSVAAVPEAATWAMLIAGFGVIGFAMRRHREVANFA